MRTFVIASDQSPDLSSTIDSVHLICMDGRGNHNKLIPLPIGMSLNPEALLGNYAQVQHQQAVLQALKAGIERVTQIRTQIQQTLKEQQMGQTERSFWINWGEAETIEIDADYRDTRSDCVSWS